jgi:NAD-dependent deacetylase
MARMTAVQGDLAVVVLTGAGVSADSGLPTFRDAGGLWEGHRVEEVATPHAWRRDPALVWRFYQLRRAALVNATPNDAHRALVELERALAAAGAEFILITQNVDDLHERAGSRRLLHMHGEIAVLRCEHCHVRVRDLSRLEADAFAACAVCGNHRLRPDVVWFGEMPYHLEAIERALAACTHFLAIGTSGAVYPAAGFLSAVRANGARTWVQALESPANASPDDTLLLGRAADTLPELVRSLRAHWSL